MGSKRFVIHSPQSPIYGETLARCTRAVYPPRFLRTTNHRWANVFFWLWLGHMYMESKGCAIHSPRSPIYGETLARCTRAVSTPLDFPGRRHADGLVCFFGFGQVICTWEANVLPCIAPEARSMAKP
jgi:hypothetical protein